MGGKRRVASRADATPGPWPPWAAATAALALPLVALSALACFREPATIADCVARDGVTPICGFQNPEDLARLPGGSWIAVSQRSGPDGAPGSLIAFRRSDGRKLELFPAAGGASQPTASRDAGWGEPDCDGPPDPASFSPHGIDSDIGAHRLAVVNHGGRESVELFEIGRSQRGPAISWRGCVLLPAGDWPNDVALLADGGFLVTRMMRASAFGQVVSGLRMLVGLDSGHVLEWRPDSGLRKVPNSSGNGPNGIASSRDGREIFFSEWGGRRLVRLRQRADGSTSRKSVELPLLPDNLTWTRTGSLLVTGQSGPIGRAISCARVSRGTCALAFSVFEVEPTTLAARELFRHDGTAVGAGSVALQIGPEILIGTVRGDRLGRAPFDRAPASAPSGEAAAR